MNAHKKGTAVVLTVIIWNDKGLPQAGFRYTFHHTKDHFLMAYVVLLKGGYAI